jgi:Cof subfamily protein (haloacid dehalogenase superfamily)
MKLIASDMDGTLLQNGVMQVSDRAIQLIDQLKKQDYLFVAASGRQYSNLKRQFKDVAKDMAFICENGAVVVYQEEFLFISPMEHNLAMELCYDIYNRDGCEVLISGKDVSYLKPKDSSYLDRMQNIVKNNVIVIDNFEDIKEPIVKISVFEKAGIVENSASYFLANWESRVKCTVSGFGWLDFVNPHVNKGSSLLELMNKLNIKKEDTFAFGDNYNDIEMLQTVEHGYVMENAVEDIKKRFNFSCRSVEEELEKLI